jgi:hypothetical protein
MLLLLRKNIYTQLGQSTKENGEVDSDMDMDSCSGLMELLMKVNGF